MTKKRRKKSNAAIIRYLLKKGLSTQDIIDVVDVSITPISRQYIYVVKHYEKTKRKKKKMPGKNGVREQRTQKKQMAKRRAH